MKTIELITKLYGMYGIVALLWMRSLAWGAKSQWNKGAFTVGLIVLLSTAAIVHDQHSQHESRQAFDVQVSELTLGLENAKFKAAADAIDTCRRISIATPQKSARTRMATSNSPTFGHSNSPRAERRDCRSESRLVEFGASGLGFL